MFTNCDLIGSRHSSDGTFVNFDRAVTALRGDELIERIPGDTLHVVRVMVQVLEHARCDKTKYTNTMISRRKIFQQAKGKACEPSVRLAPERSQTRAEWSIAPESKNSDVGDQVRSYTSCGWPLIQRAFPNSSNMSKHDWNQSKTRHALTEERGLDATFLSPTGFHLYHPSNPN
jgi:hypothetical protein